MESMTPVRNTTTPLHERHMRGSFTFAVLQDAPLRGSAERAISVYLPHRYEVYDDALSARYSAHSLGILFHSIEAIRFCEAHPGIPTHSGIPVLARKRFGRFSTICFGVCFSSGKRQSSKKRVNSVNIFLSPISFTAQTRRYRISSKTKSNRIRLSA